MDITGTYELKNNDKGVLSITLENYAFAGDAHGNTIVKALNFDIMTGHIYTLPELFKPNSNYIKRISLWQHMRLHKYIEPRSYR